MRGAPTRDGWLRQVLVREYNKLSAGRPGGRAILAIGGDADADADGAASWCECVCEQAFYICTRARARTIAPTRHERAHQSHHAHRPKHSHTCPQRLAPVSIPVRHTHWTLRLSHTPHAHRTMSRRAPSIAGFHIRVQAPRGSKWSTRRVDCRVLRSPATSCARVACFLRPCPRHRPPQPAWAR